MLYNAVNRNGPCGSQFCALQQSWPSPTEPPFQDLLTWVAQNCPVSAPGQGARAPAVEVPSATGESGKAREILSEMGSAGTTLNIRPPVP
jgi:hypothetical protein